MRNKRVLFIAVPGLVVMCCIVAFAIAVIVSTGDSDGASDKDQTRANANLTGPICQGTPLADAPSYTQSSGTHPLIVLQLGNDDQYQYGFIDPDAYRLPDGWTTRYVKELELVVCVDQVEQDLVETCEYTIEEGEGTATLSRYSRHVTLRLLEAQTGREIAADTLIGMPAECQDTEEFLEDTTGKSIFGDAYEELEDWLRPHVEIP